MPTLVQRIIAVRYYLSFVAWTNLTLKTLCPKKVRVIRNLKTRGLWATSLTWEKVPINEHICAKQWLCHYIQSTVSTAKRFASFFWYLIASTIDTLHNTINGCEIACIWNSKYNVHVCMIQTNADFIFQKLIVFVSCWL